VLAALSQHFMPLESPRPVAPNSGQYTYQAIEDVNARLWQDPFTAITQHKESPCADAKKCTPDQWHDIDALDNSVDEGHKKTITVLGVMVFGGSSVDNVESRRRTRYAVLSGLAVKGYAPQDAEHIGYFNRPDKACKADEFQKAFPWSETIVYSQESVLADNPNAFVNKDCRVIKSLPEKIPFEWFNGVNDESSVLLLWLDEIAFASIAKPLESTKRLVEQIKAGNSFKNAYFNFIGPAGSDTLQLMFNELNTDNSVSEQRYPFRFYDASASDDWPGLKIPLNKQESKSDLITRTSLTDYQLAKAIVEELKLRGIKPLCETTQDGYTCQPHNKDHIVIISEWDTLYGRSLPKATIEALAPGGAYCISQGKSEEVCYQGNWIHRFSYMRGLDGVVPDEGKTTEQDKSKKEQGDTGNANSEQERPEGQSQKDYLRRLSARISELEREFDSKGEGQITAIGVLGSDAYDKLMVLKSLRSVFPKAIFFTTDLDTRLMHPDDFDVTRNLIVAASFGLQLDPAIQKVIPPFRDSYQTAHFLATQIALTNAQEKILDQKRINEFLGNARVFEISHNKAIDLSDDGGYCESLQECKNVHPPIPSHFPGWRIFLPASIGVVSIIWLACILSRRCRKAFIKVKSFSVVFFILLACKLSQHCRKLLKKLPRFANDCIVLMTCSRAKRMRMRMWTSILYMLLLLLVCVLGVVFYEISLGSQGEPFYWTAGVSVWPSELIRLLAGILGCLFIANTVTVLERNKLILSKKYFGFDGIPVRDVKTPLVFHNTGDIKRVNVKALWRGYCWRTSAAVCNRRVIFTSLLFMVLALSLISVLGLPNTPYRGDASLWANRFTLFFSVPVFIVLVMTVVNATWRCVEFISKLDSYTSVWPKKRFAVLPCEPIFLHISLQGEPHRLRN